VAFLVAGKPLKIMGFVESDGGTNLVRYGVDRVVEALQADLTSHQVRDDLEQIREGVTEAIRRKSMRELPPA
jgi:hypothetical protein